jgi:alkanesulfonate monooxygenase SsuD/methylene tetrahydromethanopterin reductase-like flavin-dependent oxidoreductase (luciferase family)
VARRDLPRQPHRRVEAGDQVQVDQEGDAEEQCVRVGREQRLRDGAGDGRWFKVRGPLNVSRPPPGRPVFVQAGASDRGRDFAARWAEVIFVTHSSPEAGLSTLIPSPRRRSLAVSAGPGAAARAGAGSD